MGGIELLTVRECAHALGCSVDYVRARIALGELRALRAVGRGYRVRREWLDDFLNRRVVTTHDDEERASVAARVPRARTRRPPAGDAETYSSTRHAREALFGRRGGDR
jgi:excisionase family DNA binding protein